MGETMSYIRAEEPSGRIDQAIRYIGTRTTQYTPDKVGEICKAYADIGDRVGIDWFVTIAQMVHETGSLTSWWSKPPRRNPAGLGVTGEAVTAKTREANPARYPATEWAQSPDGLWRRGLSFDTWAEHAIPAHIGRILAYCLPAGHGDEHERQLISQAMAVRSLPGKYRGVARTWTDLNGRWAWPGTTYGQRILEVAAAMRRA